MSNEQKGGRQGQEGPFSRWKRRKWGASTEPPVPLGFPPEFVVVEFNDSTVRPAGLLPPEEAFSLFLDTAFGQTRTHGQNTTFREYPTARERERIFTIGKTFATYAHDRDIKAIVYPDVGARLLAPTVNGYWDRAYPTEMKPETYFVNPQALQSKEDVVSDLRVKWDIVTGGEKLPRELLTAQPSELTAESVFMMFGQPIDIDRIAQAVPPEEIVRLQGEGPEEKRVNLLYKLLDSKRFSRASIESLINTGMIDSLVLLSGIALEVEASLTAAQSRQDIQADFAKRYPGLARDHERNVMVVDTCIHQGTVINPVLVTLEQAGFQDVKVGVVSSARNHSSIIPDLSVFGDIGCYPMGKDTLVKKQPNRLDSVRASNYEEENPHMKLLSLLGVPPISLDTRDSGRQSRKEIRRIMKEHP